MASRLTIGIERQSSPTACGSGASGGAADIVGRAIALDGRQVTVIGVLPREFQMFQILNREVEVYLPLVLDPAMANRRDQSLNVYARLRPGVSFAEAQGEMAAVASQMAREFPATNESSGVTLIPVKEAMAGRGRATLLTLMAAVAMVLLIACANVANLLLARARARRREIAVRIAIGGSRAAIVRQLLAESLVLAAAGGVAGLLLAVWTTRALDARITQAQVLRMHPFAVNWAMAAFTLCVSALTAAIFGLAPALRSSRMDVSEALKGGDAATRRSKGWFVMAAEAALTAALLAGAGAAVKHAAGLASMDRGIETRHVLSMQLWLAEAKYRDARSMAAFFESAVERVRAQRGVEAAGVVNYPPAGVIGVTVPVEGIEHLDPRDGLTARYWVVSPGFRETVRLRLLRGRFFDDRDSTTSAPVAVVSEAPARRLYGGDAIGQTMRPLFPQSDAFWVPRGRSAPLTIAGVVADIDERGAVQGQLPQLYLPYSQNPVRVAHVLARTAGDPMSAARAVEAAIAEVDSDQAVSDVKPLGRATAEVFAGQRSLGAMIGVFAVLAVLLAAVGVYAVVASGVASRMREIAMRSAVGASPSDVAGMVVVSAVRPAAAGVAIGLAGAAAANWALAGVVSTWDASVAAAVCGLVVALAGLAAAGPALRASHVDANAALRRE